LDASDMLLGMQSQEEALDVQPVTVTTAPAATSVADLNAKLQAEPQPAVIETDELF